MYQELFDALNESMLDVENPLDSEMDDFLNHLEEKNIRMILVGNQICEFNSMEQYKKHGKKMYNSAMKTNDVVFSETIAIDAGGKICTRYVDVIDSTFPVKVFKMRMDLK